MPEYLTYQQQKILFLLLERGKISFEDQLIIANRRTFKRTMRRLKDLEWVKGNDYYSLDWKGRNLVKKLKG